MPSPTPCTLQEHTNPKTLTPQQLLSILSKTQMTKERLLKQLQQLDIDITPLQNLTLHQIFNQVEPIMKNTYSIKYLGLNKNEMGIVSRRIDPTKDSESILHQPPALTYTINKYFYPKPLKVGKKQPKEEHINVQNLQNQIKKSFQNSSKTFKRSGSLSDTVKLKSTNASDKQKNSKKSNILGSWMSISKLKNTIYNQKRQKLKNIDPNRINLNEMTQNTEQNKLNLNSYAKFLSKGIILVKDC